MLENIVFFGGNTLFSGFEERALELFFIFVLKYFSKKEIRMITPDYMEPKLNFIK